MEKILNIHISNKMAIDLNVLTKSLNGLVFLYKDFIKNNNYSCDPKLYIKEIKNGSIDVYISAGQAIYSSSIVNPLLEFTSYLINIINFF